MNSPEAIRAAEALRDNDWLDWDNNADISGVASIIDREMTRKQVTLQNPLSEVIFQMVLSGESKVRCMARMMDIGDPDFNQRIMGAFPEIMEQHDKLATASNKEKHDRIEFNSLDSKDCKDG